MKKFKCEKCESVSTSQEWNNETIEKFGSNIIKIQDVKKHDCACFVCPNCLEACFKEDKQIKEV